jgi:hypothetical protein
MRRVSLLAALLAVVAATLPPPRPALFQPGPEDPVGSVAGCGFDSRIIANLGTAVDL